MFYYISAFLIYIGMIMDELSTRIALEYFSHAIFEANKFSLFLMKNDMWLLFDIVVTIIMHNISIGIYLYTDEITGGNEYMNLMAGGAIPIVYGGARWFAAIHNIELILGCMKWI